MSSLTSFDTWLIAGRAVALLLAFLTFAYAFRHWRRAAERDTQRLFEQLDLVRADLLIMKEVMQSAANRVDIATRAHRDSQPARAHSNTDGRGYEIAARMARNGASKDELTKNCGITTHEAELLVRLHSRTTAPSEKSEAHSTLAESTPLRRDARPPTRSRLMAVG